MRRVELRDAGGRPRATSRPVEEGVFTRVARGLCQHADAGITAPHDLAEFARRMPKGVICPNSACQFHDLMLRVSGQVWIAVGPKARTPRGECPPVRVARFGEQALLLGARTRTVDGLVAPIFDRAKSVADCFGARPWLAARNTVFDRHAID